MPPSPGWNNRKSITGKPWYGAPSSPGPFCGWAEPRTTCPARHDFAYPPAFDGNKESLASNYKAVSGYNMCVCVDIRYVLWILEHYMHQDYLLKELDIR